MHVSVSTCAFMYEFEHVVREHVVREHVLSGINLSIFWSVSMWFVSKCSFVWIWFVSICAFIYQREHKLVREHVLREHVLACVNLVREYWLSNIWVCVFMYVYVSNLGKCFNVRICVTCVCARMCVCAHMCMCVILKQTNTDVLIAKNREREGKRGKERKRGICIYIYICTYI